MFKRLHKRLLVMNLSMISILMLISFSTIYMMTYNNVHSGIEMDLHRVSEFGEKDENPPLIDNDSIFEKKNPKTYKSDVMPERTVSFSVRTDLNHEIVATESFFETDQSFFETALTMVLSSNDIIGQFNLEGNEWAYMITESLEGTRVDFIDMTAQQNVLDRLVYTFFIVSVVSLLGIFFISNFLTNRSVQPVNDAFEKQKMFISDASHELKTPLAVIRTNVDVLLSNQGNPEDAKWLTYIKSEVERMTRLTNDLLYLTQMENTGTAALLKSPVRLNDPLESLLLGMDAIAYEKGINLDYEMEPEVTVYGNVEQLTQVALILLDNALKYTPEKGHIHLSLKRVNHYIRLVVTNNGDGIAPEDISHIFDRFYRADKARSRADGSYGLGLSIAKAIVEQHGGKITCESIPFGETSFIVKLPLKSGIVN